VFRVPYRNFKARERGVFHQEPSLTRRAMRRGPWALKARIFARLMHSPEWNQN